MPPVPGFAPGCTPGCIATGFPPIAGPVGAAGGACTGGGPEIGELPDERPAGSEIGLPVPPDGAEVTGSVRGGRAGPVVGVGGFDAGGLSPPKSGCVGAGLVGFAGVGAGLGGLETGLVRLGGELTGVAHVGV